MKALLAFVIFTSLGFINMTQACTSIGLTSDHQAFGGRNFDWSDGEAYFITVPRHTREQALALPSHDKPLIWHTHYGAVYITMGEHHHPLPAYVVDGMNTQGLSMAVLELSDSQFQTPQPGAHVIGSAQLPARVLSDCATVDCAINTLHHLTVVPSMYHGNPSPVHYMLRDATGDSAVVAYQKSQLVIHHPLKLSILTNTPYIKAKNTFYHQGVMNGYNSMERFTQAAHALLILPPQKSAWSAIYTLFPILIQTQEPANSAYPTQWSIVRNQTKHKIFWQTLHDPRIRWINLNHLSFKNGSPMQVMSLQTHQHGNMNHYFKIYKP